MLAVDRPMENVNTIGHGKYVRNRKVGAIPMRMMAGITRGQAILDRSARNAAIIIGTKALTTPKSIAPEVLANIRSSSEIGARTSLTNKRLRFSKVMVTASIEVVLKRMEMVITPPSLLYPSLDNIPGMTAVRQALLRSEPLW